MNPYAPFARDLARPEVLAALQAAAGRLKQGGIEPLIPEVMTNLGYATPYPEGPQDVAAFPGRILKSPQGLLIPAPAGLRRLPAHRRDHPHRHGHPSGAQERHEHQVLRGRRRPGAAAPPEEPPASTAAAEPPEVKAQEGGTLAWGVAAVLKPGAPPPDLIYDRGDWGKEPMIRILGPSPMAVAEKALALKNALQAAGRL